MKRESGIDLVRITGLLFVVGVHEFLYNGFYYEPQVGSAMWGANTARWLFFCCNGIFMMLTGYLRCNKHFQKGCYKGLLPVLTSYVLCCAIIFPVQYLLGEKLPFIDWLTRLVTFGNYAWYVEMYIGLVLFSPVVNMGLAQMKDRQLIQFACIMVGVSSLHNITALGIVPNYWSALYPVTYYIIGATIRRVQPKVKPWQGLGFALLVSMGLALATLVTTDEGFSKGFTQGYGGFWTMLTTAGMFLGLYRVKVSHGTGKVLAWLAGGVFEGYLLSKIFDLWTYPLVKQWHTPENYWKVFLCITVPTFICTLLLGKAVNTVSGLLLKRLPGYRGKFSGKRQMSELTEKEEAPV